MSHSSTNLWKYNCLAESIKFYINKTEDKEDWRKRHSGNSTINSSWADYYLTHEPCCDGLAAQNQCSAFINIVKTARVQSRAPQSDTQKAQCQLASHRSAMRLRLRWETRPSKPLEPSVSSWRLLFLAVGTHSKLRKVIHNGSLFMYCLSTTGATWWGRGCCSVQERRGRSRDGPGGCRSDEGHWAPGHLKWLENCFSHWNDIARVTAGVHKYTLHLLTFLQNHQKVLQQQTRPHLVVRENWRD